jgi:HEAT repeat protein
LLHEDTPIAVWLKLLQNEEVPFGREAVPVCGQIGDSLRAALPSLVGFLTSEEAELRAQVVAVLSDLAQQAQGIMQMARVALRQAALREQDEVIRTNAVRALANLGPQAASHVPALVDALRDEIPAVRMNAAYTLGEMGPDARQASTALFMALRDRDMGVRVHVAAALWKIERRDRVVVPVLIQALRDPDEVLRWIAADCLRDIGPAARDAVPALKEALEGDFKIALIRTGVALALERIEAEETCEVAAR